MYIYIYTYMHATTASRQLPPRPRGSITKNSRYGRQQSAVIIIYSDAPVSCELSSCVFAVGCDSGIARTHSGALNPSIEGRLHRARTRAGRSHIPAAPQGAANPASRSNAGLEG